MALKENSVVLITGGKAGIGRAIADRLAAAGHRVFVTSRSATPGVVAPGIEMLRLDAGDAVSVDSCVQGVFDKAGRIDVLINSIGNGMLGAAEEISEPEGRRVVDDLFWSATRLIQAVLPAMRAQGSGRIISISSVGGQVGMPYSSFYSAGKFALTGFSESLRAEVRPFGVHVSLIIPAGVKTPVLGNVPKPSTSLAVYAETREKLGRQVEEMMRKGLSPDQVADVVEKVLASPNPRFRYFVGAPARGLALFMRLAPEPLAMLALRKMFGLP